MTRNDIISALYTSKSFNDCIKKHGEPYHKEDLKQEVIAIVLELPDEKVIDLHTRGVLEYYVVRIVRNQIMSSSSPFFKTYRRTFQEVGDIADAGSDEDSIEDRETKEALEDRVLEVVEQWANSGDNGLYYRGNLIKLYMQVGNYRAIERATKIPFISCYKNIQQSIKMIEGMINNKPVFTKEELREAHASAPKIKLQL
jgi:hypothetical protein